MADYRIGENLFADDTGKWFNVQTGNYKDANGNSAYGQYRNYIQSPFDSSSDKINQLYDAQRKSQLDSLKQQRDKAISGFNQQKKDLAPQYQAQRNQADVVNAQNVTRLRELMAANGINASGESLTTQANLASARQNALSGIDTQENQAMGAIDKQIADANDPSQEQAINNSVETERSKALYDALSQYQQQIHQQEQEWRAYELQQQQLAEQKRQFDAQQAAAAAARSAASSSRSSGGSSGGSSSAKVTKLSPEQSFAQGMDFWNSQINDVKSQGAYRVEQSIRNDPAKIQELQSQGVDVNSFIDALYNTASDGEFKTKSAFQKYYDSLVSPGTNQYKQAMQ